MATSVIRSRRAHQVSELSAPSLRAGDLTRRRSDGILLYVALRSWATGRRVTTVDAGTGSMTAFAYSAAGRLAETASGTGMLAVPVEPNGFTYLIEH